MDTKYALLREWLHMMIKNRKAEKQITGNGHALSQVKLCLCDAQRHRLPAAAQPYPFGFTPDRKRAAVRWNGSLGVQALIDGQLSHFFLPPFYWRLRAKSSLALRPCPEHEIEG
jgi:hypothetical protein